MRYAKYYGYIIGVILESAARKYRDYVFDKGDSSGYCRGDEGVGLLKVEVKLGSCSSTVFEREAVKLADSPFRSPRLVILTLSNFSTSRTRSRGKPSQGTRCQDSPEIYRLLLGLVRSRRWTSLHCGSPTFHCACAIVERRENMTGPSPKAPPSLFGVSLALPDITPDITQ